MTYIFLGPSLNLVEAQSILEANYLPPAQQGDILSLVKEKKPKIIGLIDGYFSQTLSVWHKEILYALQEGVTVLGSSSMGALRAAEIDSFGMIGIGKVYEMYRDRELTDDDEVALVHGPEESGYLSFSLPMVNIRMTLQQAVEKGILSNELSSKWIACAKELYYPERTVEQVNSVCALTDSEKKLLVEIFNFHYVDQKKEDALNLLRAISEGKIAQPSLQKEPLHDNGNFKHLFYLDRSVECDGEKITLEEITKYIALHHPNFSQLRRHALNRWLVSTLAEMLEIQVELEEIESEKERFKIQNEISFQYAFEEWLSKNHFSEKEFDQLMEERAKAQKLYHSPLGGYSIYNLYRAILDELKLNNQFEEWFKRAGAQKKALQKRDFFYLEKGREEEHRQEVFLDQIQNSQWDLDASLKKWSEEAGFTDLHEVVLELHKSFIARKNSTDSNIGKF